MYKICICTYVAQLVCLCTLCVCMCICVHMCVCVCVCVLCVCVLCVCVMCVLCVCLLCVCVCYVCLCVRMCMCVYICCMLVLLRWRRYIQNMVTVPPSDYHSTPVLVHYNITNVWRHHVLGHWSADSVLPISAVSYSSNGKLTVTISVYVTSENLGTGHHWCTVLYNGSKLFTS